MLRQTNPSQAQAVVNLARQVARRFREIDSETASDIAQEVVIVYLASDVRPAENWEAWVTTVTRNRAIDYLRKPGRSSEELPQEGDADALEDGRYHQGPSAAVMGWWILSDALRDLSPRDRRMLELSAQGYSNAEVASMVGLANANSAGVTLSRIKKRLRDQHPELVGDMEHPRLY